MPVTPILLDNDSDVSYEDERGIANAESFSDILTFMASEDKFAAKTVQKFADLKRSNISNEIFGSVVN